jgi:hypothetical protein
MFNEALEYTFPNFTDNVETMVNKGSRASLISSEKLVFLILSQINYENNLNTISNISYLTPFNNLYKILKSLSKKRYIKIEDDFYIDSNNYKFRIPNVKIYCYNNLGKVINNYEN